MFLPGTSPWKRAFLGTLVGLPLLLALLMMLVLYFFRKQRKSQGTRQSQGAALLELALPRRKVVEPAMWWGGEDHC